MKKIILALLVVLAQSAQASETLPVPGELEVTPEATLQAIKNHFKQTIPGVQGDAFVEGSLSFSMEAKASNQAVVDQFKDDFERPEEVTRAIALGKSRWETPFANGHTFSSCFPKDGRGAAASYPQVDATGQVVTFEKALNNCLTSNHETPIPYGDMDVMGALSMHARKLSNGSRVQMTVSSKNEKAAFERGKIIFYGQDGKTSQACASCHIQNVGGTLGTERFSPAIGQAAHWPLFRPNKAMDGELAISTLQKRYLDCQKNTGVVKPIQPGSTDSNDLEYFHTYLSQGLPLSAGGYRK